MLLHSPSGAGKTSLVQAALVDRLQEEGFEVLPIARVNIEPPAVAAAVPGLNRYALSVLMSLQQNVPLDDQLDGRQLAGISIDRYLTDRPSRADNRVLIFDQFEEVLSRPRRPARQARVLRAAGRRAAAPGALGAVPGARGLRGRARPVPACAAHARAHTLPAGLPRPAGRPSGGAAARGADGHPPSPKARWTSSSTTCARSGCSSPTGRALPSPGPFVEPVQLQVVCRRLWERLGPGRTEIPESDIERFAGEVDTALATYYAEEVAGWRRDGCKERVIREWFVRQLIVDQRFRGTAAGPQRRRDDGRTVLRLLEDAHLIRSDQRLGTTWYELAHDRLVTPVQEDNARWRQLNLHPLQRQAVIWERRGPPGRPAARPPGAGRGREVGRGPRGRADDARPRLPRRRPTRGSARTGTSARAPGPGRRDDSRRGVRRCCGVEMARGEPPGPGPP